MFSNDLYKRSLIVSIVFSLIVALLPANLGIIFKVEAAANQHGQPQITLNPGGGLEADGSDGMRFTINSAINPNYGTPDYGYVAGQDGVTYKGTHQYCCSAGGPMLNIGGQLFGQAGPAQGSSSWTSLSIISTSGVTSLGTRTSATGNSSATVRYIATRGGREYILDRTVSYIFPNDFVLDNYTLTIPSGNSDQVKFYLGGDTSPGSSDSGYGIMLTSPVRSVISLNQFSQIMFGFREVQGSKTFDGATSQHYLSPYSTVSSGGNIGFVETESNHDAGLMVQWNFGTTPGTYNARLQQFVTTQGTNLNAAFASSFTATSAPVDLNISVVNSELDPVDDLGYTLTLPANLLIDDTVTSDCGGSLTATVGTGTITISNIDIAAASNCVVTAPVASSVPGQYVITADSASGLQGALVNNIGTSTLNVGVYTLSFATQGGSLVDDINTAVSSVVEMPSAPTRHGYIFLNWNTAANGTGTAYDPGDDFTMPGSDTTIYAIWEALPTYDIEFDEQGGSDVDDIENQLEGEIVELPGPSIRSGFTFIGWNTAADGSGTTYDAEEEYTIGDEDLIFYAIWDDNDGIAFATESEGPNGGDANDDGTADSEQIYVASFVNTVNNQRTVIEVLNTCELSSVSSEAEQSGANQDSGYVYSSGLMNFTAECSDDPGSAIEVKLYFYNVSSTGLVLRKYNPNTNAYFTIEDAEIESQTIGGESVTVVTYEIIDGGELDLDGEENSIIVDPVGLGAQFVGAPNTGLGGSRKKI